MSGEPRFTAGAGGWTYVWDHRRKPHVHPVATPSGHVLTRVEPPDHPWQRGIWFVVKFVDGDNFWEEGDPKGWGVQRHTGPPEVTPTGVRGDLAWVRPDRATVAIHEHRRLDHVVLDDDHAYAIDWDVTLTAPVDALLDRSPYMGVWGGYSGLAFRGRDGWRDTRLLLDDARCFGIAALPLDVNRSDRTYRVERVPASRAYALLGVDRSGGPLGWRSDGGQPVPPAGFDFGADPTDPTQRFGIRLGLQDVAGIDEAMLESLLAARPFASLADLRRRGALSAPVAEALAHIGALDGLAPDRSRRDLLLEVTERWSGLRRHQPADPEAPVQLALTGGEGPVGLAGYTASEQVRAELEVLGLDASRHVVRFYDALLARLEVTLAVDLEGCADRQRVRVAGAKVATQTPLVKSGQRVIFTSLDDGTGVSDSAFFEAVHDRCAATVFHSWLLVIEGKLVRRGRRGLSVTAERVWDLTALHAAWRAGGLEDALRDPDTFSSEIDLKLGNIRPMIPQQLDPPAQTRYRRLLDPLFSRKKMAELVPAIRSHAKALIDELRAERETHAREAEEALAAAERAKSVAARAVAESTEAISKIAKNSAADPQAVSQTIERIVSDPISGGKNFWPAGSTLGITFLNGPEELRALVRQHAVEWTKYANINFDFDAPRDAAIRVDLDEPLAWSYLGIQARVVPANQPTITLGAIRTFDDAMQNDIHERVRRTAQRRPGGRAEQLRQEPFARDERRPIGAEAVHDGDRDGMEFVTGADEGEQAGRVEKDRLLTHPAGPALACRRCSGRVPRPYRAGRHRLRRVRRGGRRDRPRRPAR